MTINLRNVVIVGLSAVALAGCGSSQVDFLGGLRAINPALGQNVDRDTARGKNVCLDIEQGKTDDQLANNAVQRFSGPSVQLTPDQGRQIVELARKTIC